VKVYVLASSAVPWLLVLGVFVCRLGIRACAVPF